MTHEEKLQLQAAKRLYETANADQRYVLESIFPELRELEDEKIRKAIIESLPKYGYLPQTSIKVEDALAWLEKQQVEQKPTDNDMKEALRTEYEKGMADAIAEIQKGWSEDDEQILRTIISDGIRGAEFDMLQINWLKSLKDRYTWKPSDEQLKALGIAIRCGIQLGTWEEKALDELREQLKKLREEKL